VERNVPGEAECKRSAARLNDILPDIFDYADRKRLTKRPFAEYDRLQSIWEDYPEEWEDHVLGMLAAFSVCGRAKNCAAFVRSVGESLSSPELALAREWRSLPWIWSVFEVVEELGGSRFAVKPLGTRPGTWAAEAPWERLIVYSPTVAVNLERGIELFLTQLAPAGGIFHTYGVIIPFQTFDETDLFAFADYVRCARLTDTEVAPLIGMPDSARNLSDIIALDSLSFLQLYMLSEAPALSGRMGIWRKNASFMYLSESIDMKNPEFWEDKVNRGRYGIHSIQFIDDCGAIYLQGGSPMYDPMVFISFNERRIYLSAYSDEAYQIGREALLPVARFPQEPDVSYSLLVDTAVEKIIGIEDELRVLQEELPPPDEQPDIDEEEDLEFVPTMEEAQRVIDRLVYNHNEGIDASDMEIARQLDVTPEIVGSLRKLMEKSDADAQQMLPGADWMGLNPRQVNELYRDPVPASSGAIELRDTEELSGVGETPILRFTRWFFSMAGKEGRVPATRSGYVKPALIDAAINAKVILSPEEQARKLFRIETGEPGGDLSEVSEFLKPKREGESLEFLRSRELLEAAGLIRLSGNAFEITKKGRSLTNDDAALYRHLLVTAFRSYDWYDNGRLEPFLGLRERAGFLFYALHMLCGGEHSGRVDVYRWLPIADLADVFLSTYPVFADDNDKVTADLPDYAEISIYGTFVSFFCDTFGLLESRADESFTGWLVRPTPLLQQVFNIG